MITSVEPLFASVILVVELNVIFVDRTESTRKSAKMKHSMMLMFVCLGFRVTVTDFLL